MTLALLLAPSLLLGVALFHRRRRARAAAIERLGPGRTVAYTKIAQSRTRR